MMKTALVQETEENEEMLKTYSLVLKFKDQAQRREANNRIKALEAKQEKLIHDKLAQQIARKLAQKNPNISYPVTEIQKRIKKSPNVSFSAYHWLFTAEKITVDNEKKVYSLFEFLLSNPQQAIEWFILGRSPFTEYTLSNVWKVKYVYTINLLTSTRRQADKLWKTKFKQKYSKENLEFNSDLPKVSQQEVEQAIKDCYEIKIEEYAKNDKNTKNQQEFLSKLHLLNNQKKIIAPYLTSWINTSQPARWNSLKKLSKKLAEIVAQDNLKLNSSIRLVVVFALFPYLWKTVSQLISSTNVEEVVISPFTNKRKGRLPIKLLMKYEYDIIRPGNSSEMTQLALKHGSFNLGFPKRGFSKIIGSLIFPEKVLEYLRKGAKIKILQLKSGIAPNYKPRVSVILSGTKNAFLSSKLTRNYIKTLKVSPANILGLDINRVSKHMLSLSNEVELPKNLRILADHYITLTKNEIPKRNKSLTNKGKQKDSYNFIKAKGELRRVHQKRTNILREIRKIMPHYLAAVIVKGNCKLFCIEDLEKNTRGKKGAIAKAVFSMPYRENLFEKAVQIASHILGYEVKLIGVDPRNSSKYHYNCGGLIQRDWKNYDYAECKKCRKRVNTHYNAAKNIAKKGEQQYKAKKLPLDAAEGMGSVEPSSKSEVLKT
ncbi:MAG: zinc ribbon domain-containing protein [Candidatus Thorarchaeota archaeon]